MPRNKREIAPAVKRAEICDVALQSFCERGYEGTSMARIAETLQLSQNTIYWYFGNKDQLLMAVVEDQLQLVTQQYVALPESSIAERLHWMFERVRGMGALIHIVHGRVPVSESVRDWHQTLHQRLLRFFVERLLRRGVPETRAEVVVQTVLFAFEGVVTHPVSQESATKVFAFLEASIHATVSAEMGSPHHPAPLAAEIQSAP
jgi:AcrR family transcriptional regulator